MKYPALALSVCGILGILCSEYFSEYCLHAEFLLCVILLILIISPNGIWKRPLLYVSFFLIFFLRSSEYEIRNDISSQTDIEDIKVTVEGRVLDFPRLIVNGNRRQVTFTMKAGKTFSFHSEAIEKGIPRQKIRVRLYQCDTTPSKGDLVRVFGFLKRPEEPSNPGEFDYKKYLQRESIHYQLSGYGITAFTVIESSPLGLKTLLTRARAAISERIDHHFNSETGHWIRAILLGERHLLGQEHREDFIRTGTAHLLAVSGIHLVVLLTAFMIFVLCLGIPVRKVSILPLLFIIFYVAIGGAGIPLQRAGGMALLAIAGLYGGRKVPRLNSLFIVMFGFLFLHPQWLFSISFQLSFMAVFVLLLAGKKEKGMSEPLPMGLWAVFAVTAGTAPLVLYYFNVISWISPFANIVALPLFYLSLVSSVITTCLVDIPILGSALISLTEHLFQLCFSWVRFCASFPWSYKWMSTPQIKWVLIYYSFFLAYLISNLSQRCSRTWRYVFLLGALISFSLLLGHRHKYELNVTFLTHGDEVTSHVSIDNRNHWFVSSGKGMTLRQAGRNIKPYFRYAGINNIKGVIFTDHRLRAEKTWNAIIEGGMNPEWVYPKTKKILLKEDPKIWFSMFKSPDQYLIVQINIGKDHVLLLPDISPEIIQTLKANLETLRDCSVLFISKSLLGRSDQLAEVREFLNPAVVLWASGDIEETSGKEYSLGRIGSVSYLMGPEGARLRSHKYGLLKAF